MGLSERTQKMHEKEKTEIDRQMKKFGDLPADYDDFVENTVFDKENYIFYSKKTNTAYCTKCSQEFELTKDMNLKHNEEATCPSCHKQLVAKSSGMSRNSLFAVQWSVLVQKHEEEVLVRYFCHTKDFRADYHNPKIRSFEKYRTVHEEHKSSDFEWGRFKSTDEVRWCIFKERSYGWCTPSEMTVPRSAVLYNTDLLNDVAGTCMKYSAVDIYVNKVLANGRFFNEPWTIDWYFNSYRRKPYIEQLLKVGFYRLVIQIFKSYDAPKLAHGRSVLETLKVNKMQFNMLREIGDPSFRDVDILKYGQNLSIREFEMLRQIKDTAHSKWYEKYIDMRQYTTIYKLDKYITKSGVNKSDYFDYVSWIRELGYDMRNEFNLYPKNFQKAHDEKADEYIKLKDKQAREEAKKFNKLLKELRKQAKDDDAMNLRVEGLFIRLPNKLNELKKEGETLHHCVGTYTSKVVKGETTIFFIRREEEPDKPFYTMEWKDNRIAQCRGFKNCDMTPEVKAFTKLFEEKMLENINGEQKTRRLKNVS